jgi:Fur family ferric uptake transcriptional regulator
MARSRARVSPTPAPERWADHALGELEREGHRPGGARTAVVELLDRQACCLSAQEIYDALRAEGRVVGIASVYRALDLLGQMRLVQRVDLGGAVARYEPAHPTGEHHHHVVCTGCGRVEAFEDPGLERAIAAAARALSHTVDEHEVVLRGHCADCGG